MWSRIIWCFFGRRARVKKKKSETEIESLSTCRKKVFEKKNDLLIISKKVELLEVSSLVRFPQEIILRCFTVAWKFSPLTAVLQDPLKRSIRQLFSRLLHRIAKSEFMQLLESLLARCILSRRYFFADGLKNIAIFVALSFDVLQVVISVSFGTSAGCYVNERERDEK